MQMILDIFFIIIYTSCSVFHTGSRHRLDDIALRDNEYRYRNDHHYYRGSHADTGTGDTAGYYLRYSIVEGLILLAHDVYGRTCLPQTLE